MDELGQEILGIVFPAVFALTTNPITFLIQKAFIRHKDMTIKSTLFLMNSIACYIHVQKLDFGLRFYVYSSII